VSNNFLLSWCASHFFFLTTFAMCCCSHFTVIADLVAWAKYVQFYIPLLICLTVITPCLGSICENWLMAICADSDKLIDNLGAWNLVPRQQHYACNMCGSRLVLRHESDRTDGLRWVCQGFVSLTKQKRRKCGNRFNFRTGTFFAKSHLEIFEVIWYYQKIF